jgi:hypothetical protein
VFANTNLAAAGGVIAALITTRLLFGKADLTMALNGAIAGLVAITADPLSPSPLLAAVIGGIGGVIVVFSIVAPGQDEDRRPGRCDLRARYRRYLGCDGGAAVQPGCDLRRPDQRPGGDLRLRLHHQPDRLVHPEGW